MTTEPPPPPKRRVAFLLVLAIVSSLLFFWVIKDFVVTLFLAAIFAGLLHPAYRRISQWIGGRDSLASAITVLLSLVVVVLPALLFLGIVVSQASEVSASAQQWLSTQQVSSESLQGKLAANAHLKHLLPYQDKLIEKGNELAAKAGAWMAGALASGAQGAGAFLLLLFVMLYATFYFLTDGRAILDKALCYTPLSDDDRLRLRKTVLSVSRATLKGKLIIGIVQGALAGLSFWVAGVQGVLFWSVLMSVLSVIPSFGTALVWVPTVIFLAITGKTGAAIGVGLWCAVVVGTVDNVLTPKLIGKDTDMPDLLVLLATLGGLAVFDFSGILIGPIVAAIFLAVWQLWGGAVGEVPGAVSALPADE